MSDKLNETKALIATQTRVALLAIQQLGEAMDELDSLLYSVRYPALDDDLDYGFNADGPYKAIGDISESLAFLRVSLATLHLEVQ